MNKKIKTREFNYRLEDVVGEPPRGLSYYGSGLIFLIIILLIVIAGLVKYPETIHSEIDLTSVNPPRKMIAMHSTYIDSIHASEGQFVKKNQIILQLKHNNDLQDIHWLNHTLSINSLRTLTSNPNLIKKKKFSGFQKTYDNFRSTLNKVALRNKHSLELIKIQAKEEQIDLYQKELNQINTNIQILKKKVKLHRETLYSDSILAEKGLESNRNVRELKMNDLNNEYYLNEEIKQKYRNELKINELKNEIHELSWNISSIDQQLISTLHSQFLQLKNKAEEWSNQYIIKSNVDGVIHFNNKHWVKGAFVAKNEEIFKITPKNKGKIIAYAKIADRGSSNVKIGQRVNIKLNNYPYKEYGILVGKVEKLVTTPSSHSYLIHIHFPKGLKTSYNKQLKYHPQMQGQADIVTRKQSLLTKIFYEIKTLIYN